MMVVYPPSPAPLLPQLLLFIWVVGPTAFFLWKTLSDQPLGPQVESGVSGAVSTEISGMCKVAGCGTC